MRTCFGSLFLPLLFMVACAAETRTADDDDTGGIDAGSETCNVDGLTRCSGQEYQTCNGGSWHTSDTCASGEQCYPSFGCAQCDPTHVQVCVDNNVVACTGGVLGGVIQECGAMTCNGGSCGGTPTDCADNTQVIYVVDKDYNLLSFDPRNDANTFHLIGALNCPAGPAFPGQLGAATPFSMSVDRDGRAWVLYSSGEIFLVSTTDASCQPSGYVKGSQGFELFGMSFVSNTAGGEDETLFIAGGAAASSGQGQASLGAIVPATYATSRLGTMAMEEYSPELTGTGNGELWAYFPGMASTVAKINKANGATLQSYNLPAGGLFDQVNAWAFAHYGGRYYIFVTITSLLDPTPKSQVLRLDPAGNGGAGATVTVVPNSPYQVVGAGVSTCAPVVVE